ncbi:hypothetical protein Taro_024897 [Colocasia esculenta]|uniref:Uncharacterized protein n=1 Tax=Colocasia esculenta TaxID=4460 RepID=A0A843V8Q5_COLES|nr:hypothetical protein [Colocasia esculenta]
MPRAYWACRGLQASGSAWVLLCLPFLFAWCLALEGLSRSEVVSISWDPHPRKPLREHSGLLAEVRLGIGQSLLLLTASLCVGMSQAGKQREWPACPPLGCQWRCLGCCCCDSSRSWVPVCGGTGVCGFPTMQCVRGPRWFYLWALNLVESRSWVPVCGGTGMCGFLTMQCVRGPRGAETCFQVVPDSVGFYGSHVYVTTLVGGPGIAWFCSAA